MVKHTLAMNRCLRCMQETATATATPYCGLRVSNRPSIRWMAEWRCGKQLLQLLDCSKCHSSAIRFAPPAKIGTSRTRVHAIKWIIGYSMIGRDVNPWADVSVQNLFLEKSFYSFFETNVRSLVLLVLGVHLNCYCVIWGLRTQIVLSFIVECRWGPARPNL